MAAQTRHTSARGFTALELIIVLIIGFTLIALSASKMGEIFSASKSTQAIANISGLASAVQELQAMEGYAASGTNLIPKLLDDQLGPKLLSLTTGTTGATRTLNNEWGGLVTLETAANNTVTLTYGGVPAIPCKKIVKNTLFIGTFKTITGSGTVLTSQSTVDNIVTACTPDANAQTVDLVFTM